MPQATSGVSIRGFQRIGGFNETQTPWQLRFASAQNLAREVKLGNALICLPISNNRFPVVYSVPVYGGGIAPVFVTGYPVNQLELWVSWFQPGYQWFFERPAVGE